MICSPPTFNFPAPSPSLPRGNNSVFRLAAFDAQRAREPPLAGRETRAQLAAEPAHLEQRLPAEHARHRGGHGVSLPLPALSQLSAHPVLFQIRPHVPAPVAAFLSDFVYAASNPRARSSSRSGATPGSRSRETAATVGMPRGARARAKLGTRTASSCRSPAPPRPPTDSPPHREVV